MLVAADGNLLTYDISSPKSPRALRVVPVGHKANCILAHAGTAYVGTDSGIVVSPIAGGNATALFCAGTSQTVAALTMDSTRLYAAAGDGITVFKLAAPDSARFIPLAGEPTGVARHDSRLFVSLRNWGVRVFNILPGDSFAMDTLKLGRHSRAEGVTLSPNGYCIISQGDSGVDVYYTPAPDTVQIEGGGGGGGTSAFAAAVAEEPKLLTIYEADSSIVEIEQLDNRSGASFGAERGFTEFTGFTRRTCVGGNGYVYTASGDAGIYIIRE